MSSIRNKKLCIKCTKTAGTATCGGCQAWFCTKHFIEHREGLSHEMEYVGQQHDQLHKCLNSNNVENPLLSQIDDWEKGSMKKIQETAENARNDLIKYINQTKSQLSQSLAKIRSALESSRSSDDYTELELKQWSINLEKLRNLLDNPPTISIVQADQSLALIRVTQRKGIRNFDEKVFDYASIHNCNQI